MLVFVCARMCVCLCVFVCVCVFVLCVCVCVCVSEVVKIGLRGQLSLVALPCVLQGSKYSSFALYFC